jgi:D-alanyl-D-alanine carboxypeptidase/D-alanyl-D-alanine-endopeptidase (penicillin-binding protein 4)
VVNKKSNNLFTELVFRTMGRSREGVGSPEASARAVASALVTLGVDTAGVVQADGSGLSAGNRVRASTFVSLLGRLADSDVWGEMWATLPEAGNRRELARMYRTPAAGNLRAKTGTIEGVSALSGVVQSRDGERLAFSILVNGTPSTSRAKAIENEIGVRLASFTRGDAALPPTRITQLPPPPIPTDSGGPARHLVERGESFDVIARRYGLTLEELRRANPDIQPRRLRVGSWIAIPSGNGGGGT